MAVLSGTPNNPVSGAARALTWCCEQIKKLFAPTSEISSPSDAKLLDVPRYCYDASLLFRRMTLLRIDRDELNREEPLLLRELQGICTLCGSKAECVRDLAREREAGEPQDWQDYCPNVATLKALGALQNCFRAAEYLKRPHSAVITNHRSRHERVAYCSELNRSVHFLTKIKVPSLGFFAML